MDPITAYIRVMWEERTKLDPVEEELQAKERGMLGLILRCCPPQQLEIDANRRLILPVELSKILERSHLVSPWCFYVGYQGCIHLVSACFWREYRGWVTKKVKNKETRGLILNGFAGARFEHSNAPDNDPSLFRSKFRRVTIPEYFCSLAGIFPEGPARAKAVLTGGHSIDQTCSWLEIWALSKKLEFDTDRLAGKQYKPGFKLFPKKSGT